MRRVAPFVLLLSVAWFGSAEDRCIQQSRFWGGDGPAQHLVVVNDHAFFGGYTLRVADLGDPTLPEVVHELRFEKPIGGLESSGDRVYLIDHFSELTVIDAELPGQARVEGTYILGDPNQGLDFIDIHGDLGVVAGSGPGTVSPTPLVFFDVSGPAPEPVVTATLEIQGVAEALAMGERTAVVAMNTGLIWFIDVSNPNAPSVGSALNVSDLIAVGEVYYLAARDNTLAISDTEGNVTLIDISDPVQPASLSFIQTLDMGVVTLTFDGPTIHAAGSRCTQFGVCGGYALINAVAPTRPEVVGRLEGPQLTTPAPHAGYVVAAAFGEGMRVVDLRDLQNPALLEAMFPMREVGAIASAGDLMHVVDTTSLIDPVLPDRNALRVLDRLPDGSLAEVGSYSPAGAIWALAATGDHVAAAIWDEEIEFHSLEVIDVSTPDNPAVGLRLGANLSYDYETDAPHLRMKDGRMLLSLEGSDDILIYELSDGGRATQIGTVRPGAPLANFAMSSRDTMVVAVRQGDTGWIEVIDTRVPSSPVVAATIAVPEPADVPITVEAEGDRVVILVEDFDGFSGSFRYSILIDVAEPSNPIITMESLVGGRWVAITAGVLHTVDDAFWPAWGQHLAQVITTPPDVGMAENLGRLDVTRDRVDPDGSYFCVSDYRLEVYRYGRCYQQPGVRPVRSSVDE